MSEIWNVEILFPAKRCTYTSVMIKVLLLDNFKSPRVFLKCGKMYVTK